MKNLSVRLLSILATVLFLSSTAFALVEGLPYSASCETYFGQSYDSGQFHAYLESPSPDGYAEAMIGPSSPWDLHSIAYVKLVDGETMSYASGYAEIHQQFIVTGAGDATIEFHYDGTLAINDPDNGLNGLYSVSFFLDAYDSIAQNNDFWKNEELSETGSDDYAGNFTFNYTFSEDEIGNIFDITLELQTGIGGEGLSYNGPSYAELSADFFNTASITGVNGPIAPLSAVPIPGAIWLLAPGLTGLFAVRLNKKSRT